MRLMLWAHPRSRSTAFERAFIERGDCTVLHEPLSKTRYHGADPAPLLAAIADPEAFETSPLLADIRHTPPSPTHAVVKDMPSHTNYSDAHLASFTHHVLLVRNPAASIRSYHAVDPDFLPSDAGYAEMLSLGQRLVAAGAPTMVVEADSFAAAPEVTLRGVCEFLGIAYEGAMVSWKEGRVIPAWKMWTDFHTDALASTTIVPAKPKAPPLPAERLALVAELEPLYRAILGLQDEGPSNQPLGVVNTNTSPAGTDMRPGLVDVARV